MAENTLSKEAKLPPLTREERAELAMHEKKIEGATVAIFERGMSLMAINNKKLYRDDYPTFEAYVQDVYERERRWAYQLIDAAEVYETLGKPELLNERHARELIDLEPEQRKEVWTEAVKTKKPTAALLAKLASRFKKKTKSKPAGPSGWGGKDLEKDKELAAAFDKIAKTWGRPDTNAVLHGGVPGIKRADVLMMAKLPTEKLASIANLVVGNLWKPQDALNFLKSMPDMDSTCRDLAHWALAEKGHRFSATIEGVEFVVTWKRAPKR